MESYQLIPNILIPWILSHGLKIIGILIAAFLLKVFAHIFIERLIRKTIRSNHFISPEAEKKREDTLINVFNEAFGLAVVVLGGLMVLSEAGVETTPLIAAAGIVGLAFGFGGQYLIKDLISGFLYF